MGAETVLLERLRDGRSLSRGQRLSLIARLSVPSMLWQLSYIIMVYIDASMVGRLGAEPSAAVGLVATTTWLFGGLISAASMGFSVQVAQIIGANEQRRARDVMRQGYVSVLIWSLLLAAIAVPLSFVLPRMLGGGESIASMATSYFLVFALCLPGWQMSRYSGLMLQSSGNMKVPSAVNIAMCVLDVILNFFLIFPTREITVLGHAMMMPGADLGVLGASLGTSLSEVLGGIIMTWYVCCRSKVLAVLHERGSARPTWQVISKAFRIGLPIGLERTIMCGAQIATTAIVAPLGNVSIAANSFAVTAESLCYMPGYGIGDAATTLVGQSVGAKRKELVSQFANMTILCGVVVMTVMGVIMFLAAPWMIGIMTPVQEIKELGTYVLRIEAFAEPLYAASIVAYSSFIGTGDTVVPACMNFLSIWVVRVGLSLILAPILGLAGVWIAMAVELCFRGVIFLIRLFRRKWLEKF
ncbi:MAG: MATE family efflux transporter [Bacteroidales bacterium]|nr:MATE family efflux transporter [Bacteroidales bacterium]